MITNDYLRVAQWVSQQTDCDIPMVGTAIGEMDSSRKIRAGVLYESFTGPAITGTIAIAPGYRVGRRFLRAIFEYPFLQLGVKKVYGIVNSTNERALKFDLWCGFTQEAVLEGYFLDGDALILSCTKDNCIWLRK